MPRIDTRYMAAQQQDQFLEWARNEPELHPETVAATGFKVRGGWITGHRLLVDENGAHLRDSRDYPVTVPFRLRQTHPLPEGIA